MSLTLAIVGLALVAFDQSYCLPQYVSGTSGLYGTPSISSCGACGYNNGLGQIGATGPGGYGCNNAYATIGAEGQAYGSQNGQFESGIHQDGCQGFQQNNQNMFDSATSIAQDGEFSNLVNNNFKQNGLMADRHNNQFSNNFGNLGATKDNNSFKDMHNRLNNYKDCSSGMSYTNLVSEESDVLVMNMNMDKNKQSCNKLEEVNEFNNLVCAESIDQAEICEITDFEIADIQFEGTRSVDNNESLEHECTDDCNQYGLHNRQALSDNQMVVADTENSLNSVIADKSSYSTVAAQGSVAKNEENVQTIAGRSPPCLV